MTIQKANDRLWSCLSSDPKPGNFAPGILLIETDTGIWWISQEDHTWKACYPTVAQHQALHNLLIDLVSAMEVIRTLLKQAEADIAVLKKGR